MKKILFLLLAVALFVNCDPKFPNRKGNYPTMILLKPAKGVQLRSTVLNAIEVDGSHSKLC